jgi:hypothetical protein
MASPYIIGALAEAKGLGFGPGATVVFNIIGLAALFLLPETVKAGPDECLTQPPQGGTKSRTQEKQTGRHRRPVEARPSRGHPH